MRRPSKPTLFAVLMVAAALSAFVLPSAWTGWIRRPFQLAAAVNWPLFRAAQGAREVVAGGPPGREAELQQQVASAELRLAQLQAAFARQQELLDRLSGLRGQTSDAHFKIILAPVVAYDAHPRRDTLQVLLTADQRTWVRPGQWVLAGAYVTATRETVAEQWVVGRVAEVLTRSARIQLATDSRFRAVVRVGRFETGAESGSGLRLRPEECALQGVGTSKAAGRMRVTQATANHYQEGDRIVVTPASPGLPSPMVLGTIVSASARGESALHFDLDVIPWGNVRDLTHVFIVSAEP